MANRKLLGEIDRVLKKVDEGVTIFEQIWDKVYSSTTTAQKEKNEGDLKKEIKKLQRLRDQIKTWQGDSSIKDKTKLDANRKLIEEKMEKFKICEKETKTKAFSKEGLAQDRIDPKQKAKAEVGDWVRDAISRLREQSDEFEAEIELLNSGGKRKKRVDENPRVSELKDAISRHEHHVEMLERVLRAVDNDQVSPEECNDDLRESVEYYLEANQDADFMEDEGMYDSLNLDFAAPLLAPAGPTVSSQTASNSSTKKSESKQKSSSESESASASAGHLSGSAAVAASSSSSSAASAAVPSAANSSSSGSGKQSAVGVDATASDSGSGSAAKNGIIVSPKGSRGGRGAPDATSNSASATSPHTRAGQVKQTNVDGRGASSSSLTSPTRRGESLAASSRENSQAGASASARTGARHLNSGTSAQQGPPPLMSTIVKGQASQSQPYHAALAATQPQHGQPQTSQAGKFQQQQQPTAPRSAVRMPQQLQQAQESLPLPQSQQEQQQQQTLLQQSRQQQHLHSGNSHLHQQGPPHAASAGNPAILSQQTQQSGRPAADMSDLLLPSGSNSTFAPLGEESLSAFGGASGLPSTHDDGYTAFASTSADGKAPEDVGKGNVDDSAVSDIGPYSLGDVSLPNYSVSAVEGADLTKMQDVSQAAVLSDSDSSSHSASEMTMLEQASSMMPELPHTLRSPGTSVSQHGLSRNAIATPPSFPTVAASVFDNRTIFEKFDPDTLFFIFYYQQGTYQQYLAARELKRQGWRFHKKYLTWFQRHEEPRVSTDTYETGTFVYFDYANVVPRGQGTGWCQRIKSEFVFEYRYLEDELV